MSPPDEETCVHERTIRRSDGSIECLICPHVIPAPEQIGDFRSEAARARAKLALARELEPTDDDDDRPAA